MQKSPVQHPEHYPGITLNVPRIPRLNSVPVYARQEKQGSPVCEAGNSSTLHEKAIFKRSSSGTVSCFSRWLSRSYLVFWLAYFFELGILFWGNCQSLLFFIKIKDLSFPCSGHGASVSQAACAVWTSLAQEGGVSKPARDRHQALSCLPGERDKTAHCRTKADVCPYSMAASPMFLQSRGPRRLLPISSCSLEPVPIPSFRAFCPDSGPFPLPP